jgi:hypothetical protein
MIAYQTNHDGVYVGIVECDESPLEPGVFLVPAGAVTVEPPSLEDDEVAVWDGAKWRVEVITELESQPEPYVPTREDVEEQRRSAYQQTADPLFFGWQRGENTEQEWLAAVQDVKDANPYSEDVTTDETE